MLRGLKERYPFEPFPLSFTPYALLIDFGIRYEVHHGVRITDEAIVAAAVNSNRYIADRFLPDKAIDLVDEAASRLRLQQESKPWDIERLDRDIITLKIEAEALKKEKDEASQTRLKKIQADLAKKQSKAEELTEKWNKERAILEKEKTAAANLEKARRELERCAFGLASLTHSLLYLNNISSSAQRSGQWTRASELQYGVIPDLERTLKEREKRAKESQSMVHDAVTAKDIAQVVARATGTLYLPLTYHSRGGGTIDRCLCRYSSAQHDGGGERAALAHGRAPFLSCRGPGASLHITLLLTSLISS